jgi:predicted RecB family nuclease
MFLTRILPPPDICRWWKECARQWRRDDHLSFVAGASRLQRKELMLQGIPSLESLAKLPLPIDAMEAIDAAVSLQRIAPRTLLQVDE